MIVLGMYMYIILLLRGSTIESVPVDEGSGSPDSGRLPQSDPTTIAPSEPSGPRNTTQSSEDENIEETFPIPQIPPEFINYPSHESPFAFTETKVILAKEMTLALNKDRGIICVNVSKSTSDPQWVDPESVHKCADSTILNYLQQHGQMRGVEFTELYSKSCLHSLPCKNVFDSQFKRDIKIAEDKISAKHQTRLRQVLASHEDTLAASSEETCTKYIEDHKVDIKNDICPIQEAADLENECQGQIELYIVENKDTICPPSSTVKTETVCPNKPTAPQVDSNLEAAKIKFSNAPVASWHPGEIIRCC